MHTSEDIVWSSYVMRKIAFLTNNNWEKKYKTFVVLESSNST